MPPAASVNSLKQFDECLQISWCVSTRLTKEPPVWSLLLLSQGLFPLTLMLVPLKLSQHSFIVKADAEKMLTPWPFKNIRCHLFSFSSEEQISSSLHFSLTYKCTYRTLPFILSVTCELFWCFAYISGLFFFFLIFTLNTFLFSIGFFFIIKSLKNSLFSQLGVPLIFLCHLVFRRAFPLFFLLVLIFLP